MPMFYLTHVLNISQLIEILTFRTLTLEVPGLLVENHLTDSMFRRLKSSAEEIWSTNAWSRSLFSSQKSYYSHRESR
jgi:hypothetical protein